MNNKIGHNQPPSQIEFTIESAVELNSWLTDHPVILSEEDAREGKLWLDRSGGALKDLEDERNQRVRPLNEQVKLINDEYRGPKARLDRLASELRGRLNVYIQKETAKREAEAAIAHAVAEEAKRAAEEAEEFEAIARDEATQGVVTDIGRASEDADQSFRIYQKAERDAQRAERAQNVKVGGGFRRSLSLRSKETLLIVDAQAAVDKLGWTSDILAAILKAARAYRQLHGALPPGIKSEIERSI